MTMKDVFLKKKQNHLLSALRRHDKGQTANTGGQVGKGESLGGDSALGLGAKGVEVIT